MSGCQNLGDLVFRQQLESVTGRLVLPRRHTRRSDFGPQAPHARVIVGHQAFLHPIDTIRLQPCGQLFGVSLGEPCQAHPNQHIVGMIGPGCDDPSELFATGRGELWMSRTVALPFDGQEGPIANRVHRATASQADVQRSVTPGASLLLPGEDESRHAVHLRLAEQGGLLALLFQDLVDG